MSNNEFVMVPREQLKRAADRLSDMGQAPLSEPLFKLMNEQHQGEPVAWVVRWADDDSFYTFTRDKARSEKLRNDPDLISTPLYTHADPGEVERLRGEVAKFRGYCVDLDSEKRELEHKMDAYKGAAEEAATLRAQLAERDALLRDISKKNDLACDRAYRNGLKKGFGYGINGEEDRYNSVMESYHRSIAKALAEDALSASAEPSAPKCETCSGHGAVGNILNAEPCPDCSYSAPVEIDHLTPDEINQMAFEEGQPAENGDGYVFTQEEFDLFVTRLLDRHNAPVEVDERAAFEAESDKNGMPVDRLPSGDYLVPCVRFAWQGWMARAALDKPS